MKCQAACFLALLLASSSTNGGTPSCSSILSSMSPSTSNNSPSSSTSKSSSTSTSSSTPTSSSTTPTIYNNPSCSQTLAGMGQASTPTAPTAASVLASLGSASTSSSSSTQATSGAPIFHVTMPGSFPAASYPSLGVDTRLGLSPSRSPTLFVSTVRSSPERAFFIFSSIQPTSMAEGKRADEVKLTRANEQLENENKRAEKIKSVTEALVGRPTTADHVEKLVDAGLDTLGWNSKKSLEREYEQRADVRRLGEIVTEQETPKSMIGGRSSNSPSLFGRTSVGGRR